MRVRPDETQVYVNGYYAGIADDFDGAFRRLYLPTGEHHLAFRLEGYEASGRTCTSHPAIRWTFDTR